METLIKKIDIEKLTITFFRAIFYSNKAFMSKITNQSQKIDRY